MSPAISFLDFFAAFSWGPIPRFHLRISLVWTEQLRQIVYSEWWLIIGDEGSYSQVDWFLVSEIQQWGKRKCLYDENELHWDLWVRDYWPFRDKKESESRNRRKRTWGRVERRLVKAHSKDQLNRKLLDNWQQKEATSLHQEASKRVKINNCLHPLLVECDSERRHSRNEEGEATYCRYGCFKVWSSVLALTSSCAQKLI